MIMAELRGLYSDDIADLGNFVPELHDVFCIWVRAMVGPRGERGEESFLVGVCTPPWLAARCETDGFVRGAHYLIVGEFDWPRISTILKRLIQNCSGETWEHVARKLGQIGLLEFDDCQQRAGA
jgi:hypothetical protein